MTTEKHIIFWRQKNADSCLISGKFPADKRKDLMIRVQVRAQTNVLIQLSGKTGEGQLSKKQLTRRPFRVSEVCFSSSFLHLRENFTGATRFAPDALNSRLFSFRVDTMLWMILSSVQFCVCAKMRNYPKRCEVFFAIAIIFVQRNRKRKEACVLVPTAAIDYAKMHS